MRPAGRRRTRRRAGWCGGRGTARADSCSRPGTRCRRVRPARAWAAAEPVALDDLADLDTRERACLGVEPELGTGEGATAAGRYPSRICSRPPWQSWTNTRGAVSVHGVGDRAVGRHHLRPVPGDLMRGEQARRVRGGRLDRDQSRAAGRAGLVVGDEIVGRDAVGDEAGLVGGRDDAVAQLDRAEGQGGQQVVEAHRADGLSGVAGRGSGSLPGAPAPVAADRAHPGPARPPRRARPVRTAPSMYPHTHWSEPQT